MITSLPFVLLMACLGLGMGLSVLGFILFIRRGRKLLVPKRPTRETINLTQREDVNQKFFRSLDRDATPLGFMNRLEVWNNNLDEPEFSRIYVSQHGSLATVSQKGTGKKSTYSIEIRNEFDGGPSLTTTNQPLFWHEKETVAHIIQSCQSTLSLRKLYDTHLDRLYAEKDQGQKIILDPEEPILSILNRLDRHKAHSWVQDNFYEEKGTCFAPRFSTILASFFRK